MYLKSVFSRMANELFVAQERDCSALLISVASGFSYTVPFSSVRCIPPHLSSWTPSRLPQARSLTSAPAITSAAHHERRRRVGSFGLKQLLDRLDAVVGQWQRAVLGAGQLLVGIES